MKILLLKLQGYKIANWSLVNLPWNSYEIKLITNFFIGCNGTAFDFRNETIYRQ